MAGLLVIKPEAATFSAGGTGVGNLGTPSPREIWVAPGAGSCAIDVDLGTPRLFDSIYLGNTNAQADAVWYAVSIGAVGGAVTDTILPPQPMQLAGGIRQRHPCFARFAAPVTHRFLRVVVEQPITALEIGNLIVGMALDEPYAFGSGRSPVDTSRVVSLQDGGFGVDRGVVKVALQWRFPDLSAASLARLWAIAEDRGESAPLVVVEGPDYPPVATSVHYGLFRRFESFEREDAAATKWALSLEEWR